MDIALLKTFIEVAATGSFVRAADRLFVTQSAVSLRIGRLEDTLGKPLFVRNRAGAELTGAGREFERYAASIIRIWAEARQQVAIPEGFSRSLTIGAQYSLWPRLGFRWLDHLQADMPDLNIRAELGMPDRLTRFLTDGVMHVALMYTPQLRPGLDARRVMDEDLVLVSSREGATLDTITGNYVFVDWGPEFIGAHALALPELTNPGLSFSLGAMVADYVIDRRAAAYLPARYVKTYIDAGQLFLVPDAPRFPYPVWAVWRTDLDADLRAQAQAALDATSDVADLETSTVLDQLRAMTDGHVVGVMGDDAIQVDQDGA